VRAFEHLGGVAASCLYDNLKTVVSRYEDGEPVYNPRFLARMALSRAESVSGAVLG
jgi:transposase